MRGGGGEKEEGLGNTFAHCPELHITFKHWPGGYHGQKKSLADSLECPSMVLQGILLEGQAILGGREAIMAKKVFGRLPRVSIDGTTRHIA